LANVLATKAGFSGDELPYAALSTPPAYTATHIDFGFDKAVPILPTERRVQDLLNDPNHHDEPEAEDDDDFVEPEQRDRGDLAETEVPVDDSNWRLLPNETTMQAFERLTQDQVWTPFWKEGPISALQAEELRLFEFMHEEYNIHLAPRHPSGKGYQSFETAWNVAVARRYQLSSEGEVIQLVKRKNVQQLRDHYQRRQERLGTAALADRASDESNHNMNRTLQAVRRNLPAYLAPPARAQPVRYQPGNMPPGNPMALNPQIVFGSMHHVNGQAMPNAIPWAFNNTTTLAMPLAQMSPVVDLSYFKKRKYCVKCGWKRRTHDEWGCTFGQQCKMRLCGKCYIMKDHHKAGGFGTQCQEPTHLNCISHYSDWFEVGAQPTTQPIQGDNGVEEMQTGEI